jgi:RimJ/RimL family protein N-acetyltransferase
VRRLESLPTILQLAFMHSVEIRLRPFGREDFQRLISWLPDAAAHSAWCGAHFRFPLDVAQLERYLQAGQSASARIFTAIGGSGEAVGHVEISHIWPHLSSRLSRVLVMPGHRGQGIGARMVSRALTLSFTEHAVDRIDLGVAVDNETAIGCYRKLGFVQVGLWPQALTTATGTIDVCWMTLSRANWSARATP